MSTVVCVGLATLDTILRVPSLPPKDGRVVASERVVAGGGPAATAAVTLARLGVDVAFVGAVGADEAGLEILDGLEDEGVDVSRVEIAQGATSPQSVVLVEDDGARSIVHHPGTARLHDPAVPGSEPGTEWVHADHVGFGPVRACGIEMAAKVSVDGGNPIDALDLTGVALYAPTQSALERDFGTGKAALDAGAEMVVATCGADGAVGYVGSRSIQSQVKLYTDTRVVSTLGAGDVFHGALLAALVGGRDLDDAMTFANLVAALSCRALDGRSAIPTVQELKEEPRWRTALQ